MNNLTTLWSNPHLRYAVIVIAALEIAGVWLPAWREQLSATQKIVTFYAVAAAANSTPTGANSQGNQCQGNADQNKNQEPK